MNLLIKVHVFLRKANLSAEKQSQIVSAAMSRYEHEPLKDAMLTAIPQAGALRGGCSLASKTVRSVPRPSGGGPGGRGQGRARPRDK